VAATRTPVEVDIGIELDAERFIADVAAGSGSWIAEEAELPKNVVFDVKPKLVSALVADVAVVTTVLLLPDGSIKGPNGGTIDCCIVFESRPVSFCSYPAVSMDDSEDTVCGLFAIVLWS